MNTFTMKNGSLHVESVALTDIAERFGSPVYVYSRAALEASFKEFQEMLAGHDALVCYAMKANSNLAVLDVFARLGAGFDVVSVGELKRVIAAGGDPSKTVFAGVGKNAEEMAYALEKNILCFNVESAPELERLNEVAGKMGKKAPVSLRVNPNVDAKTHPYISTGLKKNKFGVAYEEAFDLYLKAAAMPHIDVVGIDCHIGSQILEVSPFVEARDKLLLLIDKLATKGITLHHIDLGGGLGIRYDEETPPPVKDYLASLLDGLTSRGLKIIFEPGRRLVGNAGVLLTRIEYLKTGEAKNFAIIDAGMNDLARPVLYDAWHAIVPVVAHQPGDGRVSGTWDVVGPICESSDFLGHDRELTIKAGDLLAVMSAGAYAMSMSSNYNTRPRVAEIMVDGEKVHVVRRRETHEELFAQESKLP